MENPVVKYVRCQSCGKPLGEGVYGTNADGGKNEEYCNFCFQNGKFAFPNLTLADMIQTSVDNMVADLKMDPNNARELANIYIPTLKRWKKSKS